MVIDRKNRHIFGNNHIEDMQRISSNYIDKLEEHQKDIFHLLHDYILQTPGVAYAMKWNVPFYTRNKPLCYINPIKKKQMEWCFWNGRQMDIGDTRFSMRDRKMIRGIYIDSVEEMDWEILEMIWNLALEMDTDK